jgi:hypothetical protein
MITTYTPVPYEFREVIQDKIVEQTSGKIFFFNESNKLDDATGRIEKLEESIGEGLFIIMNPFARIRIDRIITIFGKPGAAYDEYDRYGSSCMECHGGYEDLV